jgi:hypothetical protein
LSLEAAVATLGVAAAAHRERRKHARTKLELLGRYMIHGRAEYPLQTIDVSAGGAALFAPETGEPGQRVIVYIDEIGRLEGQIVRQIEGGFAVKFEMTSVKRDKLADRITWLANRDLFDDGEKRRDEPLTPIHREAKLVFADGRSLNVSVLEVSLAGAVIESERSPAEGEIVTVGSTRGRVVRVQGEFFAMEFLRLLPADTFDENIRL